MQDRVGGSKIVVLASHSTGMLRDICNKGIVMEQGRLVHLGEIGSALEVYHRLMAELREKQESGLEQPGPIECKAYGHVSKLTVSTGLLVLVGWWADTNGRSEGRRGGKGGVSTG